MGNAILFLTIYEKLKKIHISKGFTPVQTYTHENYSSFMENHLLYTLSSTGPRQLRTGKCFFGQINHYTILREVIWLHISMRHRGLAQKSSFLCVIMKHGIAPFMVQGTIRYARV